MCSSWRCRQRRRSSPLAFWEKHTPGLSSSRSPCSRWPAPSVSSRFLEAGLRIRFEVLGRPLFFLLAGTLALSMASSRQWVENRYLRNEPLELSAHIIQDQAQDHDCSVITSYAPQVTFYSECVTDIFRPTLSAEEAVQRLTGDYRYMLLLENGKRQPEGDDLDALADVAETGPLLVEGERDWAEIYGFQP